MPKLNGPLSYYVLMDPGNEFFRFASYLEKCPNTITLRISLELFWERNVSDSNGCHDVCGADNMEKGARKEVSIKPRGESPPEWGALLDCKRTDRGH